MQVHVLMQVHELMMHILSSITSDNTSLRASLIVWHAILATGA